MAYLSDRSFESDTEFWYKLEEKPDLSSRSFSLIDGNYLGEIKLPKSTNCNKRPKTTPQPTSLETHQSEKKRQLKHKRPTDHHIERAHQRIEKSKLIIEGAKNVEAANVALLVKTTAQRELETAVNYMKEVLKSSLHTLEEAYDDLNVILSKKNIQFRAVLKLIGSHTESLEAVGIKVDAKHEKAKRPLLPDKNSRNQGRQLDDLKFQVQSLAEIADTYRVDRNAAIASKDKTMKAKEDLIKSQEDELNYIVSIAKAEEALFLAKMQYVKDDLEEFKYEVNKEIQIRDVLLNRQNNQIDQLKLELTTAKSVLKNPRLKKVACEIISKTNRTSSASRRPSAQQSFIKISLQPSKLDIKDFEMLKSTSLRPRTTKSSSTRMFFEQTPQESNTGVLFRMLPEHLRLTRLNTK